MGEVVRLPDSTVTLRDAADAFLDQDLARSTRRVYRASLASLVAGLGPRPVLVSCHPAGGRLISWPLRHRGASDLRAAELFRVRTRPEAVARHLADTDPARRRP